MEEIIQKLDQDIEESIDRYIQHIRQMSALTDDQLRQILRKAAVDRPEMFETFRDASKKKMLQDIKKMAKDMQGDAVKFARKVA